MELDDRIPLLPQGVKMIGNTMVCDCEYTQKRDIGELDNDEVKKVHVFICDAHQTILKHNIITGAIV